MFNCNWGFMTGFGSGWGMGGFGSIFNLLLFIGLGFLAYKLVQRFTRPDGKRDRKDSLELLKRKYANGDIGTEEYHSIRKVLQEG
ncbi:MAG: hypothetical protein AB7D39_12275 [Pseudodesulfovibrio sp.]|uniref:SHOCT domain-containing protein n=1 Tax=Pseudodesulfovibrio sp. TaxID=2035812 RepID=UPI003D102497